MKRIGCPLIVLAMLALAAFVRADSVDDARPAIQSRYDEFNRAYMKKDFKTVARLFDSQCLLTLKGENRTMKAERMVQGMEAMSKALTVSNAKTRIVSVKAHGDTYEVAAEWTADSSYAPPNGSKEDRARSGKTEQTVTDTWKKSPNGWQIIKRIIEGDDTPG